MGITLHPDSTKNGICAKKFITAGEIMLRLTPPNYDKIRVATTFEVNYGGSEANIALSLTNLGIDSTFFSVAPNNSLGKSAIRMLRSNDVHCTPVILSTPEETPTHRLGTFIWKRATVSGQARSHMTASTAPSQNTISERSNWIVYWMALTGFISAGSRQHCLPAVPNWFWIA